MVLYQLHKETGILHITDSSRTGFLDKCPFRLNESEF